VMKMHANSNKILKKACRRLIFIVMVLYPIINMDVAKLWNSRIKLTRQSNSNSHKQPSYKYVCYANLYGLMCGLMGCIILRRFTWQFSSSFSCVRSCRRFVRIRLCRWRLVPCSSGIRPRVVPWWPGRHWPTSH